MRGEVQSKAGVSWGLGSSRSVRGCKAIAPLKTCTRWSTRRTKRAEAILQNSSTQIIVSCPSPNRKSLVPDGSTSPEQSKERPGSCRVPSRSHAPVRWPPSRRQCRAPSAAGVLVLPGLSGPAPHSLAGDGQRDRPHIVDITGSVIDPSLFSR